MPPRKRGKQPGPKSRAPRKSANAKTRETRKQIRNQSATALAPPQRAGSGLRARYSAEPAQHFVDDPESILRKPRKPQRAREPAQDRSESPPHDQLQSLAKSIETSLAREYQYIDDEAAGDASEDESTLSLQDTDPDQIFNRKWGYLPPLDEEAAAVIDAIIEDPDMAKDSQRINSTNYRFPAGLRLRNVSLEPSGAFDTLVNDIKTLKPGDSAKENEEEKASHGQLWTWDHQKCKKGSNEALFQRTLMMNLIWRHRLIYQADEKKSQCLDFSVEEVWTCPPMPTRAYSRNLKFLPQPKPDLAVCFCRQAVIPNELWNGMPAATKRLACYENLTQGESRVFHFFTIEAKKSSISTDNTVAKLQSLNNASQALHNMFEFFHDAGEEHEEKFFAGVRFFSAATSTEGITIRVHRATKVPADRLDQGLIMSTRPDYPLQFEHEEFARIHGDAFDREKVLETFEKVLRGYGVNQLRPLLERAAEALAEKLPNGSEGTLLREDLDFYRYGQIYVPQGSSKQTPVATQAPTEITMTSVMPRGGTATPTQSQTPAASQAPTEMSIDMQEIAISTQSQGPTSTQDTNRSRKRQREH